MSNSTMGIHHGKNVKRVRELMGIKQDALAADLGMSQQSVSLLEQKETLEEAMIEKIAVILGVPEEVIKNLNEEGLVNIFSGSFTSSNVGTNNHSPYNFNPIEKIVELYERMLTAEREKNEMLMKLVEGNK